MDERAVERYFINWYYSRDKLSYEWDLLIEFWIVQSQE